MRILKVVKIYIFTPKIFKIPGIWPKKLILSKNQIKLGALNEETNPN
jgi:hypothetical protein